MIHDLFLKCFQNDNTIHPNYRTLFLKYQKQKVKDLKNSVIIIVNYGSFNDYLRLIKCQVISTFKFILKLFKKI